MARKHKKARKIQVTPASMSRPRLDAIFARYGREEIDDEGCLEEVTALIVEMGREAVMDALVRKLETASEAERDALMTVIPKLGDKETITHLWRMVRHSKTSPAVKSVALVILKAMGEDVDLDNPEVYFSRKDVKPSDVAAMTRLGHHGLEKLVQELHALKSIGEVEGFVDVFERTPGQRGHEGQLFLIEELSKTRETGAADMLLAIAHGTARPDVRRAARNALLELAGKGVFPQSSLIKAFSQEQFYAAYCTDPAHPWQQQMVMIWEWPDDVCQGIVFLLDFGFPWQGSIKDMFVTQYMSKRRLHRELLEKHLEHRRIPFARARRTILDAVEANRRHRMRLPPEYNQFQRLIERRIINPSPEALARAESLDAGTVDEWGEPEGPIVRSEFMVDGQPIIFLDDKTLEAWEDLDEPGVPSTPLGFLRGIFKKKRR